MKKFINIILLVLICFPFKGVSNTGEDNFKAITVGIGAGGFWASKYVANYYNGSENNVNKISYVLGNSYWKQDIMRELNVSDFRLYELPSKMRYKISTAVHARFAYNLSTHSLFFIQVNQVTLTAADIFTLEVPSPSLVSEPSLVVCKIWGKESRSMVDIGFQRRYDLETRNWQWFYELAFNVTSTKVKENAIQIGSITQSIINRGTYIPNHQLYDEMPQTAIGIGLAATFGVQYAINSNASLDLGITSYLQDINLEGYKNFNPNFNLFVRINLLTF
jgi:hypothetical protein